MERILDRLYLGAYADVGGVPPADLAPCTAILTLCERAPTTTMHRVHYPIPDEAYLGIPAWDTAILLVADWVMAGETLLVHCRLGVSRAPAVVAGYLALSGYSRDLSMAVATVQAIRPQVAIHRETFRGLSDWWASRPVQRRALNAPGS